MMIATTSALLSSQQERVRRLHDGCGASPYRARAIVDVRGKVDAGRLNAAFGQLIADSPVFHEPFDSADDSRIPVVPCEASVVSFEECRPRATRSRDALERWILDALDRGVADRHVAVASVMAPVSDTRTLWALQASARVADEQTLLLLVERTVNRYRGFIEPEGAGLSPLTYAEYVDWQQEMMRDLDTATARAYWRRQPRPDASLFRLPIAPAGQRRAGAGRRPAEFRPVRMTRRVDATLVGRLKRLGPNARLDVSAWLLSAWQILLWRHLETPASVQVGLFMDGRAHPVLGDVLGPCARYVPLQAEIPPGSSLADVVRRTAAAVRDHATWQDCWSWDILDGSALVSAPPAHHAFGFDWRTSHVHVVGDRGTKGPAFRMKRLPATLERFDVRLIATRVGRQVDCTFEWNRELYDEAGIGQLADSYLALLTDAVRHPDRCVADLDIAGWVGDGSIGLRAVGSGLRA
jgi:hypothetical protein